MSQNRDRLPGAVSRALAAALFLAGWITGCASSHAAESDRIAEILALSPGMRVADVGAGDGKWAFRMARRVGDGGHVFATEVDEDDLERIGRRIVEDSLGNMTAILGGAESTGLPEDCCDAILLRLVYHHFTQPAPMRASLLRALRPGGLIAVIDILPQSGWRELAGVPDRGGHGIAPDQLVAEMIGGGFEIIERIDDWPGDGDHFCVLFRRPVT